MGCSFMISYSNGGTLHDERDLPWQNRIGSQSNTNKSELERYNSRGAFCKVHYEKGARIVWLSRKLNAKGT